MLEMPNKDLLKIRRLIAERGMELTPNQIIKIFKEVGCDVSVNHSDDWKLLKRKPRS
jgi:hypothetical protein